MDTNGDGMISKDEMMRYGETMWAKLTGNENRNLPIAEAAQDFARGNLKFTAAKVDSDGDGMISKEEFMRYAEAQFNKMKKDDKGEISIAAAAKAFSRGNTNPDKKASAAPAAK
jgi:Ca2+-binding EF-hand superfamily protein